jgi:DNA polymerase-3 subunit alpha
VTTELSSSGDKMKSSTSNLRELCQKRLKELKLNSDYEKRLEYELSVIEHLNFENYFLIVADLTRYGRKKGIRIGYGRGSAAGSLVSYLLEITKVDPLKYGLLFERFLHAGRSKVQFPDIDVDFQDTRRKEILEYAKQRYGDTCVANIITFNRVYGKGTIRDVGRVLEIPLKEVDEITKQIRGNETISEALERNPILRTYEKKYPVLFDVGKKLEGTIRNVGVHAAGIIISPKSLITSLPVCLNKDKELTTQWEMDAIQEAGYLKIDILAAKIQSIIEDTIRLIKGFKPDFDIEKISFNDKIVYDRLSSEGGIGLFQFTTSGLSDYVRLFKPKTFFDIVLILGLYRPATISLNMHLEYLNARARKTVTYLHPKLEPILKSTSGIMVFQEQVIKIANDLAGFSLVDGAILTKMIAKKAGDINEYYDKFVQGCVRNGIEEETAKKIWQYMEKFAGYAFNLPHATSYAITTYQTAYLKTYYPLQYMTVLLNHSLGNEDKIRQYYKEAKRLGFSILGCNINKSKEHYTIEGRNIRMGFKALKGISSAAEHIVEHQPYTSFEDFYKRVKKNVVRKNIIEILIKENCFLEFGVSKEDLLSKFEKIYGEKDKPKSKPKMIDFFKDMNL